jgi:hypothetical protein
MEPAEAWTFSEQWRSRGDANAQAVVPTQAPGKA